MRIKYLGLLISIMIMILLMGCDKVFVHEPGPELNEGAELVTACPNPQNVGYVYTGLTTRFTVWFQTENIHQAFDVEASVDTKVVPDAYKVTLGYAVQITPIGHWGDATGIVELSVGIAAPCGSMGPYELALIVKDQQGRTDAERYGFTSKWTELSGECACATQCGPCGSKTS